MSKAHVSRGDRSFADASPATGASLDAVGAIDDVRDAELWVRAMREGNFAMAWRINDAEVRRRRLLGRDKHAGPRHLQHIWDGSPLLGKRVLVRCYHGLGDTIQFARFLAPLRELAREVIVWCQPALIGLLARVKGVDRVLPLHDATPDVTYDVDLEIMELAHALRITRPDLWKAAYVGPPQTHAALGRLSVGLAWKAGDWDLRRSLPPAAVMRLCKDPEIEFHSLQLEAGRDSTALPICRAHDVSTIDALLTTMHQLDLIVSVDTMAAHLAGAAGLETWTVLIDDCDWRWPRRALTTPWYPTMRLFHQQRPGDWNSVVERLIGSLGSRKQTKSRFVAAP
jgi:hypothetical protein